MHIGRGALATAVLAVLLAAGPAQAAPATLDDVYTQLGVDRVPSDYVVMVDVSGSMGGPRYAQLRTSLTAFFAALAPDDRVTLIPFAERATATTQPVGRAPGKLVAKLPRDADGAYTDIGAALEKAVGSLARTGAPPVATVVLLTDGRHDPGPSSAYPLTSGVNWTELTTRAAGLRKTSLEAYAIPLSGATGAPLLRKVFPRAKVLAPTSVDALAATLARPKASARAAKARAVLAGEVGRPLEVTWPGDPVGAGRTVLDVRVQSPMPHVPLILDGLAVRSDNPALTVSAPSGPLALPPGGSVTVPVTVTWDAGPRSLAPLRNVTGQAALTLTAGVSSPWSAPLSSGLGLTVEPALSAPGKAELSAQRGSLWWWIAAVALLAALTLLTLRWRRDRLSPRLTGAVQIGARTLPLQGRRLPLDAGTTGLPGIGEITAARAGLGSPDVRLRITYSPDGSATNRVTTTCAPGETVTVAGTSFTWRTSVPAPRRPSAPATP